MVDGHENHVFVGDKRLGNYIGAVLTQLEDKDFDEVHVRARGKDNIGKAVVVSEIMSYKYDKNIEISSNTDTNPETGDPVTSVDIKVTK